MKWEIIPIEFNVKPAGIPPGATLVASLALRLTTEGKYRLPRSAAHEMKEDLAGFPFTFLLTPDPRKNNGNAEETTAEIVPFQPPEAIAREDDRGYLFVLTWELPPEDLDEHKDNIITVDYDDRALYDLLSIHYLGQFETVIRPQILEVARRHSAAVFQYRKWCDPDWEEPERTSLLQYICDFHENLGEYLLITQVESNELEQKAKDCRGMQEDPISSTKIECPPVVLGQIDTERMVTTLETKGAREKKTVQTASSSPPTSRSTAAQEKKPFGSDLLKQSLDKIRDVKRMVAAKEKKTDPTAIVETLSNVENDLDALIQTLE